MARRLISGLQPRDDFPADELFGELVREQSLLASEHTLKHFRDEHFIPGPVIDRTQFHETAADTRDLRERAHAEVERHLAQYKPPDVLSAEQCRDLEGIMKAAAGEYSLRL
jgi:trimethylamine:corrinoid methyltransferase-like protein